jgi:Toprim-like
MVERLPASRGGGAERAPALALADLEAFDPRPSGSGRERRFCCPLPACGGKPRDRAHQSLSVNTESGDWLCFRCGVAGRLAERWRPAREFRRARAVRAFRLAPEAARGHAESAPQLAPLWAATSDLVGTPGAAYLAGRGLPPEGAAACGARFAADWMGRPAVVFPLHDRAGALVAANARYLGGEARGKAAGPRGPKTRTIGDRVLGAFATPGAWDARVADPLVLVEGPCDALALAAAGAPAVALVGTRPPVWLARRAFGRRVAVALDADPEGDRAAGALRADLESLGALRVTRWRVPTVGGVKDFGDVARGWGVAEVRAVAEVLRRRDGAGRDGWHAPRRPAGGEPRGEGQGP